MKDIYIYKITNKVNGRVYIGQSSEPYKRYQSHMKCRSSSKKISDDVMKYGADSFEFEIIKTCTEENFKDEEIKHIKYYRDNGYDLYNIRKGGEDPPTQHGENSHFCKHTDNQLKEVIRLLQTTKLSYSEIADITNSGQDFVGKVNLGKERIIDGLNYPIRDDWRVEIADNIIYDLQNTKLTQKEIAKKYGVARSCVTMINIGENRHDDSISYPIRKGRITSETNKNK